MALSRRKLFASLAAADLPAADLPAATALRANFWLPVDGQMVDWLKLRPGQAVLDAGCGQGDQLLHIARRLGRPGAVGLDRSKEALQVARLRAGKEGLSPWVRLETGDLYAAPFADASFDLIWTSHVLHGVPDIDGAVGKLVQLLKPGGRLVVRENRVPQTLLPRDIGGVAPGLEARLQGAFEQWFLADRLRRGRYPGGWLEALAKAGLRDSGAKSFLYERTAPFSVSEQQYLSGWLKRYAAYEPVTQEDAAYVAKLLDPRSKDWLFARRDLHFVSVSTVYFGVKP